MRSVVLICAFLAFHSLLLAQVERKTMPAVRAVDRPEIDGKIEDDTWKSAPVATDFVMFEPENGDSIPRSFQTEVRVLYDDAALYIIAVMHDPSPDSILTQLTKRDSYNENTDWFGFFINPYNDGLSDFNFWVTAAGTQADARTTVNGDDFSLNSVWKSAVRINDSGWVMEAEIPYIALRFPETMVKDWGINFMRSVRRNRKTSSWNFLDKSAGYRLEYQCGLLTDMTDIDPPVRLSAMPYFSAYADDFDGTRNYDLNAGLDLKYGINESFTLDMTLIPDFGQVAFDQQFLNLSPFENRFDENRQFFTEGTELFTIGDLLYTRRIGGAPKNIRGQDLNSNDSVTIRQEYTRLLNATKISGRTKNNLGIGVMNALTADNYSTRIEDGQETQLLTEPMTNYNVFVLDKRINRNSSLSFINTNTLRRGPARDANVAAVVGDFVSKSGKHGLGFNAKQSALFENDKVNDGYSGGWMLADISGNWRWRFDQSLITENYDINDLGFQQRNNQIGHYASASYITIQPRGVWNRYEHTLSAGYESLFKPYRYEDFYVSYNAFYMFRSFFAFGGDVTGRPFETYDYFEPRALGRWFKLPPQAEGSAFISSDYRKTVAVDSRIRYGYVAAFDRHVINYRLAPRFRIGDRFFAIPEFIITETKNDRGFVPDNDPDEIYFGRRNTRNIENIVNAQFVFNPTSSLNVAFRHSYTDVDYQSFALLEQDGSLTSASLSGVNDLNFNTFNIDVRFSWWFAPASEIVLLYRNVVAATGNTVGSSYLVNLDRAFAAPMQNNISFRLSYFLDYNTTRNRLINR
ncbi:MAG: DUF5916 domain-containing protein [Salibacteraceae bacterium]